METIYLILLTAACIAGLWIANNQGAKIFSTKLNFVVWYFIVEFFVTSVLSAYSITDSSVRTNAVFRLIPEGEFPRIQILWILSWCAVALPTGFYFANILLKKLKLEINYEFFLDQKFKTVGRVFVFENIWLSIITLYTAYVIYKIGFIPQLESLNWSPLEIAHFRGDMTHFFPASVHLKELIGIRIIPIFSFYYFSHFIKKRSRSSLILFLVHLVLSIFFVTINLNKSGLAYYAVGLIIAYGLVKEEVKLKHLITSVIVVFVTLLASYTMLKKEVNILKSAKGIYHRIVQTESYGNYYSLYYFPKHHKHIGSSSISNFIEKLGFEYSLPAARIMMKTIDKKGYKDGRAGYFTSSFIGEAWANWGLSGIIFGPIIVGFIIKFLIGIMINLPKTYLSCALIAYISHSFRIASGINNIIFPRYLIVILLLFFCTLKVSELFSDKTKKSHQQ
jgi:hypothetical protein